MIRGAVIGVNNNRQEVAMAEHRRLAEAADQIASAVRDLDAITVNMSDHIDKRATDLAEKKVAELEARAIEAETRAVAAEQRVAFLERRLGEGE